MGSHTRCTVRQCRPGFRSTKEEIRKDESCMWQKRRHGDGRMVETRGKRVQRRLWDWMWKRQWLTNSPESQPEAQSFVKAWILINTTSSSLNAKRDSESGYPFQQQIDLIGSQAVDDSRRRQLLFCEKSKGRVKNKLGMRPTKQLEKSSVQAGSVSRDGHLAGNESLEKAQAAALLVPRYMDKPKSRSKRGQRLQAFIASDMCTVPPKSKSQTRS
ncbi:hypothetical protein BDZ89DRAFT_1111444 [Hymenopellis radicata]|nr:hypothetical protein BDZ89DRAFT_1111444 [Hymenopellis radicata]